MQAPNPKVARVLGASLIGTAIEFFDFYSYATAAVLVFPRLFFPTAAPGAATLQSLATFGLAFFARPLGSALFGHFGDRVGRKATLVAALLTMGISTVLIGLLPTHASIGIFAPLLLALCRFGQGFGLGGEWGGAVLLATENAPLGKRARYGSFPQLGAPVGLLCSTGTFLLLGHWLSDREFLDWGWRVPFLASTILVAVGLYIRLSVPETPDFQRAMGNDERVRVPIVTVCVAHTRALVLGTFAATAAYVVLYLMTVFFLAWGTTTLGFPRAELLGIQMIGVALMSAAIPISAALADQYGPRAILIAAAVGLIAFGLNFEPLLASGTYGGVLVFSCLGLALAGLTYGPLGTALANLFPTAVRYTGISLSFNLAGILGASLTPYIATALATSYGLSAVGYYLSAAAVLTLLALLFMREPTGR